VSGPKSPAMGIGRVAVCVCTFNRPAGLRLVLDAIDRQRLDSITEEQVWVVAVDNSTVGSASAVVSAYAAAGRFKTTLVSEPRRGLSFARNAALGAAREGGAALIAFIDDDEVPHPSWLEGLVSLLTKTNAAAAVGPVRPVFEAPPPFWLPTSAYVTRRPATAGFVEDGYTSNCVISVSALDKVALAFDMRFNEAGGEDTILFKGMRDRGLPIAWAEQAVVHELIPRHRMTAGWLWRRWYRTGTTMAHLGRYDASAWRGKAVNLTRGAARIAVGSLRIVSAAALYGWRRPEALVASFYTACRGAGLIASVLGRKANSYTHPTYR
jgi:glycosyltransferase involved in cell wall biosynthesis